MFWMWVSRRQTKKARTQNRPKKLIIIFFGVLTVFSIISGLYALSSLLNKPSLLSPLAGSTQSIHKTVLPAFNRSGEEVEDLLRAQKISYTSVETASDAAYLITLSDGVKVLLKKENIPVQIASLQLILRRLTMEGKRFSRLDFRYDKPVIVLK